MSAAEYRRCPPPERAVRAKPCLRSHERIVGAGMPSNWLTDRMDTPPPLPGTSVGTDPPLFSPAGAS